MKRKKGTHKIYQRQPKPSSSGDRPGYRSFIISSLSYSCPNCCSNPNDYKKYTHRKDRGIEVRTSQEINHNEDDDDVGMNNLIVKELKQVCLSHDLPVSGTKNVFIDRIFRQMNTSQDSMEMEDNIETRDNVVGS